MGRKKLITSAVAAVITGAAVAFGLIDSKEAAWSAFKTVFSFLLGVS